MKRRTFLQGLGIAGAAPVVAGCEHSLARILLSEADVDQTAAPEASTTGCSTDFSQIGTAQQKIWSKKIYEISRNELWFAKSLS